jgi:hypothetical protein
MKKTDKQELKIVIKRAKIVFVILLVLLLYVIF